MKYKNLHISSLLISLILIVLLMGCKKQSVTNDDKTNSAFFSNLILDYTQGEIAPGEAVRIVFRENIVTADEIDQVPDRKLIRFEPALNGSLRWENESMLIFEPTTILYGKDVEAILDLKNLLSSERRKSIEADEFRFNFQIIPLDLNMVFQPLQLIRKDGEQVEAVIKGNLFFNARVDSLIVKKMLTFDYNGSTNPSVKWDHQAKNHSFTITGIPRKKEIQAFAVELDTPKELGLTGKYEKRFIIPAEGDFKVLSAQRNTENEREVLISLSDILDERQDLSGLAGIEGTQSSPEFRIKGNQLHLIFRKDLEGEKVLFVNAAIRSISGKTLQSKYEETFFFSTPKPAVRLLGKGIISADIDEVVLPFEAINLNAVDVEISKVYENNMLQFLQYSDLTEEYLPGEVSEIIWQDKVDLDKLGQESRNSKWTRYGLNLMNFISLEPGALYNVKIGFRKAYTDFPCENDNQIKFKQAGILELPEMVDGEYRTIWRSWYYYDNRNWNDREDPCLPMYYSEDNFVQQNILASNLGILAKYDDKDDLFVAVVDLRSGKPRQGVDVSVYSYQQQLIGTASTQTDGFADLKVGRKAYFLVAKSGRELGYLKLNNYQALSMSEFDIKGKSQSEGVDGAIFAERGVWRPGDTIYLQFVLRDPANEIPSDHPVEFQLLDPSGKEYLKMISAQHTGPFYSFTCHTDPGAKTGNWTAKVLVGPRVYSKTLQIETVKPNRLKIRLDLPEGDILLGKSKLGLDVQWLTGLPGSQLKVDLDASLKSVSTSFKAYKDYQFDDVARKFKPVEMTIFNDKLDENGLASILVDLNKKYKYPGKLKALFKVRAYEPSGEFSSNSISGIISPYSSYAGINMPRSSWGRTALKTNELYKIPVISLDGGGNPIGGKKLTVGIYEAQWHWWWDDSGNDMAQFNSDQHLMAFKKMEVITGSDGKADFDLKLEDYGAYMLRVCDTESGHCTGQLFYAGYYGGGMESAKDFAAMLQFNSDEDSYEIGQKAELSIPAGVGSNVLITLENEGQVIQKEWVESTSDVLKYRFSTTESMFPNVYAHAVVIQGLEDRKNDLPIRQYGVININVTDRNKKLEPVVTMKDVLHPSKPYQLSVSEKDGKEMYYTLAVVDDGLLDLTRFKTPDLFDQFYARRALLTKNWDNFDDVIAAKPGMMDKVISIGGDDAVEIQNDADKANRFVPVVRFIGPFHLKKNGKNKHDLDMPNYSGSVRVMVVAGSDKAYGSTEKTVKVKDDIMALITAPRVLSPGETIELPVTVFVTEPGIKKVEVSLSDEKGLTLEGDRSQMLSFDKPGEQICYFTLKSHETEGIGKLKVQAKGRSAIASQSLEIQIENPNTYQKSSERFALAPGETKEFEIPLIGTEGTNHAELEMSHLPSIGIEARVAYLIRYPYGCVEQTTSSVFPQLYLDKLMDLSQDRKNRIKINIIQGINRLKDFQLGDKSLSYWPGSGARSDWGSIYAAHFLVEARHKGYNTSSVLPGLLDYHKSEARNFRVKSNKQNDYLFIQQAYRTMVLARAGKPQFGAMNYLFRTDNLPQLAKWFLSLAYSHSGKTDVARQLLKGVSPVDPYPSNSWHYGSYLRDYAVLLQAYDEAGMTQQSAELIMRIMKIYQDKGYWSTQTLAWLLNSLGSRAKLSDEKLDFVIELAGKKEEVNVEKAVYALSLGENEMDGKKISISNNGAQELFVSYTVHGKPVMGNEGESDSRFLDFKLRYVDEEGAPLDVSSLKMGTEFKAVVTISKIGLSRIVEEIALTQIIPSGWEILNWRMDGEEKSNWSLDYQDVRDDRVLSFFDLRYEPVTIEIPLHATYPGNYYLPQAFVEAMYDDDVYGKQAGKWVKVIR